eukprot:CAMPEP_0174969248 /NCGR_PEP_ID=MMETSP0004_2-20121128/8640_1 /TAXON_ID=420556 /ORGANISM="Ochromonas sp., Strain CCMP1393" /LENGTH=340 /DNA_ID=CAMNT_0016218683 /DNA_START=1230 /DNA_END=2249 /DNA_ORIENTATION=-
MDGAVARSVKYGHFSSRGGRTYQEDRILSHDLKDGSGRYMFGIFDGHGGDYCCNYLANYFCEEVIKHPKFNSLPIIALQETWASFDDKCYQEALRIEEQRELPSTPRGGSTATVALIINDDVYIVNCGDSAAYAVMVDKTTQVLTEDHGTTNPEEVQRCMTAGGSLQPQSYSMSMTYPFCCLTKKVMAKPRMTPGGLLVTRAFGDFHGKKIHLGGRAGVVIHDHGKLKYINVRKTPLKYLVLASDGVWDVLSIEEVLSIIDSHGTTPSDSSTDPLSVVAGNSSLMSGVSNKSGRRVSPRQSVRVGGEDGGGVELVSTIQDAHLQYLSTLIVNTAISSPKW